MSELATNAIRHAKSPIQLRLIRDRTLICKVSDASAPERIHELLAEAGTAALPEGPGLTAQRAEELIDEIRAGRDGR